MKCISKFKANAITYLFLISGDSIDAMTHAQIYVPTKPSWNKVNSKLTIKIPELRYS